ncbi:MAG: dephospho-CoA kinase [Rikenellaceae bacterium]
MYKVGITGGIGSGKTTLCRMFGELGIPIYNSDAKAKALMADDKELQRQIIAEFGDESYVAGELNRAYLASKVFGDPDSLTKLNAIVHPRVKKDFLDWCNMQDAPYVILECAILFEAKFDDCVDKTVCVLAPKNMRIERVISRDTLTQEQVEDRMANQMTDEELHAKSNLSVVNFDLEDLEDAAKLFDKKIRYEAGLH